jgi:hypothetical protein
VRLEGLGKLKNPTASGLELVIFRLVSQPTALPRIRLVWGLLGTPCSTLKIGEVFISLFEVLTASECEDLSSGSDAV